MHTKNNRRHIVYLPRTHQITPDGRVVAVGVRTASTAHIATIMAAIGTQHANKLNKSTVQHQQQQLPLPEEEEQQQSSPAPQEQPQLVQQTPKVESLPQQHVLISDLFLAESTDCLAFGEPTTPPSFFDGDEITYQ